jgi:hypothetical protein
MLAMTCSRAEVGDVLVRALRMRLGDAGDLHVGHWTLL